ncbi:hypothetical protein HOY80DRAFT_985468 [Tuber brumale]|nr:hypothetical protein HOY80DRAFT_985468 [Tuber brumale]
MERKDNAQAPETDTGNEQTYAPPPGPPPPTVPEGWVSQYDPAYQRFYYVNLATQRSQWEKPPGTVDAPIVGTASDGGSSVHYQTPPPPMLASQTPPPKETATSHMGFCNPQIAEEEQQEKAGFTSQVSSFFKHGSSRSEPHQQNPPLVYCPPQIIHPQAAYMPQQRSSGMGTVGSFALGAGGGLLAGMALENDISNHGDERYEQGFEDGADYAGENRYGVSEQSEEGSIRGEGMDSEGFDEGS